MLWIKYDQNRETSFPFHLYSNNGNKREKMLKLVRWTIEESKYYREKLSTGGAVSTI